MSSWDPMQLSLTIKGALMMYVPFLIAAAATFHIPLTDSVVAEWISIISFAVSGITILVGLSRKAWVWGKIILGK